MDRSSKYFELRWLVECREAGRPASCWEPIAAFNLDEAAINHARNCAESRMNRKVFHHFYRVSYRNKHNKYHVVQNWFCEHG